ncbi:hypothetical protein LOTGIDRAFT_231460 [Lottia gigantea]|uniref:Protein twisted gastrulation n=1 Tax=Lottia gigantea TaxID=225164 RepID=V4A3L0_LOTGI|nr:hypothetical protein LOTGIDRAFT_231460 [Lottia gigantea]ESO98443.1 hypothetical protein LOTGIDRAFT_231460 [Lottia gigantea]
MGLIKEVIVTVLSILAIVLLSEACNEDICGPQVSKCMLIKCCECDMSDKKNCTCCNDCQVCLSKFYTECCDCVGLCAKQDPHDTPRKTSSVEDLIDPIPDLFKVLTEQVDRLMRWTSKSYPALSEVFTKPSGNNMDTSSTFDVGKSLEKAIEEELLSKQNCTVAFMSQCMSIRKCKLSCKSMGAAKYRWFHDNACCECISSTCYDYGLNQPQCLKCPLDDELLELELAEGVKNEGAGQMLSAVERMMDKV